MMIQLSYARYLIEKVTGQVIGARFQTAKQKYRLAGDIPEGQLAAFRRHTRSAPGNRMELVRSRSLHILAVKAAAIDHTFPPAFKLSCDSSFGISSADPG
jgi:hypothetical protein